MGSSRRRFLCVAAGTAATLAGCGGPGRASTAVFVTNETDVELRVTLRLYELPADGRTPETGDLPQVAIQRTTLPAGGDASFPGEELPPAPLRVRVVTDQGPDGSHDWERTDELSSLDVRVGDNGVRFTELD